MRAVFAAVLISLCGCGQAPTVPTAEPNPAPAATTEQSRPPGVPNGGAHPFPLAVTPVPIYDPCAAASCDTTFDREDEAELVPEQLFFRLEQEALREKHLSERPP